VRRIRQESGGLKAFEEIFGSPTEDKTVSPKGNKGSRFRVRIITDENEEPTISLFVVRHIVAVLREMGILSTDGSASLLNTLAESLRDVDLQDVLPIIKSMGGLAGFRGNAALLRAMRLGEGNEAQAQRNYSQWSELCSEVNRRQGIATYLSYTQALQKHLGLCRYCQASSSHLGMLMTGASKPPSRSASGIPGDTSIHEDSPMPAPQPPQQYSTPQQPSADTVLHRSSIPASRPPAHPSVARSMELLSPTRGNAKHRRVRSMPVLPPTSPSRLVASQILAARSESNPSSPSGWR